MNRAADASRAQSSARSAYWVAAGILLSRVAGLVREIVFAYYFGISAVADVWRAALRIPNVLQNLLGEGVLSASFIPVYAELLEEGREEEAGRVAGAIFALLVAIAGGLALVGIVFAPVLTRVVLLGFEVGGLRYDLTVAALRITFPMMGVLVLSAWALGVLNSHRRFFVSYVAPVAWNAAIIATMVALGDTLESSRLVIALAWGALVGGVLQFLVQLPWVIRVSRGLRIHWSTRLEGVRTTVRNAGPAILGRGVVQVGGLIDVMLASVLTIGAVSALGFAYTLYVLPISLFGMSVAAAELPELARNRRGARDTLRRRVNGGLGRIAFYVVPSIIGYLALGLVVVAAIYQRGRFGPADTILAYLVLAGYSLGLLATTGTRLFSSAFFALHDTKTPAKYALVRVALAAAAGLVLMLQLRRVEVAGYTLGAVGIAVASGLAAWVEWGLQRRALMERVGEVGFMRGALARMAGAAGAAAVIGLGVAWLLPELGRVPTALLVLPTYVVAYFGFCKIFGVEELEAALAGLTRRTDVD
ncbi:MAG: murein biosynthesis integral membrane protein MurJ [Gemmatimonadota bacterium]